ncbi:MAG TPA: ATP-dependent protease ATPase subunit HslU, partial [Candidatus Brocadiia bacterium]|nr:ATP-dependent protease ATPase subunit HslU [Candidatus Brocadiia bacterium]
VRRECYEEVKAAAEKRAEEDLLNLLLPLDPVDPSDAEAAARREKTREKLRARLAAGEFETREVEVTVEDKPLVMTAIGGSEEMGIDLQNFMERMMPSRSRTRRVPVSEARQILAQQAADGMIDRDSIDEEAVHRAENQGIIFIDEIDKVCSREDGKHGPDVSREGVQRDLLPIIEGSTVTSRHGPVRTDHILFIAAGAFHVSKPSDMIPELQGRFPIRVELDNLSKDDFIRILTEPRNALTRQYASLLETEGVKVAFRKDAVERIAAIAAQVNERSQNIGARRLHTVVEKLLDDVAFHAPEMRGQTVTITAKYVDEKLAEILKDEDLSRYIL